MDMIQEGLRFIDCSQTVKAMIGNGEIIAAIKEVRSALSFPLRESRDCVDAWRAGKRPNVYRVMMNRDAAILILENAKIRGAFSNLTSIEMDAVDKIIG